LPLRALTKRENNIYHLLQEQIPPLIFA
jgi:hypothetical protein